jgi:hypothetical protein
VGFNPRAIFTIDDRIYLLQGLAHLGGARGSLYNLVQVDNRWEAIHVADLGGTPEAFVIESNIVYLTVFTRGNLGSKILKITFNDDGVNVETLIENSFSLGIYATSVIKKDNLLYIGLIGGLAVFDLDSNELILYEKR